MNIEFLDPSPRILKPQRGQAGPWVGLAFIENGHPRDREGVLKSSCRCELLFQSRGKMLEFAKALLAYAEEHAK
jgi:hypothetical protein